MSSLKSSSSSASDNQQQSLSATSAPDCEDVDSIDYQSGQSMLDDDDGELKSIVISEGSEDEDTNESTDLEAEEDHTDGLGLLDDVLARTESNYDSLVSETTTMSDFADEADLEEEFDFEIEQFDDDNDLTSTYHSSTDYSSALEDYDDDDADDLSTSTLQEVSSLDSNFGIYKYDKKRDLPTNFVDFPVSDDGHVITEDEEEQGFHVTASTEDEQDKKKKAQEDENSKISSVEGDIHGFMSKPQAMTESGTKAEDVPEGVTTLKQAVLDALKSVAIDFDTDLGIIEAGQQQSQLKKSFQKVIPERPKSDIEKMLRRDFGSTSHKDQLAGQPVDMSQFVVGDQFDNADHLLYGWRGTDGLPLVNRVQPRTKPSEHTLCNGSFTAGEPSGY